MRKGIGIGLAAAFAGVVIAQQPPQGVAPVTQTPTAAVAANPRLEQLLQQWEQKMKSITALEAEVVRTEKDLVDNSVKTYTGKARFLRPDRASLYLQKSDNPGIYENFIFTGAHIFRYQSQLKQLHIYEMPPRKPGQILDDTFLALLSGMKAEDAKSRFGLTIGKEDEHYVYLFIDPRLPADQQEFKKARVALFRANFLPRQIEFEAPTGLITKWDITKVDPAARIKPEDFAPPQVPRDWQQKRVPYAGGGAPATPTGNPQPPPAPSKFRPAGN